MAYPNWHKAVLARHRPENRRSRSGSDKSCGTEAGEGERPLSFAGSVWEHDLEPDIVGRSQLDTIYVEKEKERIKSTAIAVADNTTTDDDISTATENPSDLAAVSTKGDDGKSTKAPSLQAMQPEEPYHIYTHKQKRGLVIMVSFAAIFSPLSANIYFPALVSISQELQVALELITLSITTYLIVQGFAPSLWGPLSDTYGRRPVFLGTFLVYILANLGLALLSNTYAGLMVFRGLQAGGSAATIALGSGVIGDTTVRSERGGFMGIFGGLRMFGQAFGPVLGGALAQYLGFRSIFWFLVISSAVVTVVLYFFLPETHRRLAGNGSIPQTGIYQVGWNKMFPCRECAERTPPKRAPGPPLSFKPFLMQFELLLEKDVLVTLLFGAIVYTVWSMVTATTSGLFKEEYDLSDVLIGLVFIPNGLGCVFGSYITGLIMDYEYKRAERKHKEAQRMNAHLSRHLSLSSLGNAHLSGEDIFPLERARLRPVWWLVVVFIGSVGTYGWTTEGHIAVPLVFQFLIAFTATAIFNVNSTMMIDLYPKKPASATAINNLMRCTMGALGVGIVEKLQSTYKERILFTSLAAFTLVSCSLLLIEWIYGQRWRMARTARLQEKEALEGQLS